MTDAVFWDKVAEKYSRQPIANEENYRATLEDTARYLNPSDHVIEIGAGTASTALKLAPLVERYLVTDYAQSMLDIGRKKAEAAGQKNLEFARFDPQGEAQFEGQFDVHIAMNLYHLVPELDQALFSAHGLLRSNGYFIAKSAVLGGLRALLFKTLVGVMRAFGKAPRINCFTQKRFDKKLEEQGFEIIERRVYKGFAPTYFVVAKRK